MKTTTIGIAATSFLFSMCFVSCSPKSTSSSATKESTPTDSPSSVSSALDPKIWTDANAATLSLVIKTDKSVSLDAAKFPDRDYRKKFNDNLEAVQKAFNSGNMLLAFALKVRTEYSDLNADKQNGEMRIVFNLYRDQEASWPKGTETLNMQIWGARIPHSPPTSSQVATGPLLKYDLLLAGNPQKDGAIKGTAMGRVFVDSSGADFASPEFGLKPVLPENQLERSWH